jgi:5-(carboxyamino)imidazole ribonucleotide synthase
VSQQTAERDTRPGSRLSGSPVVGMVGAGQLARMTWQAAIGLGLGLTVMSPSEDDPAVLAGADHMAGSPDDPGDLRRLAESCDVLTFDHEGVDPATLGELERDGYTLAPGASAKLLAQDKLAARRTLAALGFPVPPFRRALNRSEIDAFAAEFGWPLVLKAPRGGYDGRGVWVCSDPGEAADLLESAPGGLLLEPLLPIERELAVIVARSRTGEQVAYPVVETVQRDAMCREIIAPASIDEETRAAALKLATDLAPAIGATGVVALELFQAEGRLLVNELALRPHNSGHYSIEGCATSQFEQHLRAVLGLPLGRPDLLAPAVATVNVVGTTAGEPQDRLPQALAVPDVHVHLYGKEARPGRKLGHVTVCGQEPEPVLDAAREAAAALEGSRR